MSTDCEENADNLSKASTALLDDSQSGSQCGHDSQVSSFHKQKEAICKPYLGGYKHKLTEVIYLHASTQTSQPPWSHHQCVENFSRDSQTVEMKNQEQQTTRHVSTQVQVQNIFIEKCNEKEITTTDKYVFADEIQADILNKVIIMQRFVRKWLAQKELKKRKQSFQQRLAWEEELKRIRSKQDSEWLKEVQRRKLQPITEDDFMLLFSDLQNWWEQEVKVILKTKQGTAQRDALWTLVTEEVRKIAEINKIKRVAENKKVSDDRQKLLTEVSKPKLWKAYKCKVPVITSSTEKCENLHNLYNTLTLKSLSTQDRLAALQSLIQLLQQYNNNLTNTLKQLAQREIDLLLRGTKPRNLEGLRSRIQDLFWRYVKQPRYNSEMYNRPGKSSGDKADILCCSACKQFYTVPSSADEATGKSVMGTCFLKCKKCLYLENEGWIRKDVELYKKILKILIEEEEKKFPISSLIYILQPSDIKHLVEEIWKRQSCLSGSTNENDLELVRYDINESWTPWNCLLVTRDEAAIIDKIVRPENEYDDNFKKFVYQRHRAAKSYFSCIPRFLPFVKKAVIKNYTDYNIEQ